MENVFNPIEVLEKQYNSTFLDREESENVENYYREEYKDFLDIRDHGYTVLTKTTPQIELSKGCAACKSGGWLCVFVGYVCNANCPFCPQDEINRHAIDGKIQNSYGNSYELKYLIASVGEKLKGISYSGGEPLLYLDKVLDLAKYVNENRPDVYQWIYTNGILVDEDILHKLKSVGINEVRFNLAATNFNEEIIAKLPLVKEIIGKVTVEIPAVPEIRCLLQDNMLERLVENGVEQLNLAELSIVNARTADTYCKNAKVACHFQRGSALCLAESTDIFYEIVDYVQKNNINVLLNHCDHNAKMIQAISKDITGIPSA